MRTWLAGAAASLAFIVMVVPIAGNADGFADECLPATDEPVVTVGQVECQRFDSAHVGGTTAFSYFVPERCAPHAEGLWQQLRPGRGLDARPCPVVYYLHGTGGSYRQGTGAKGWPGPWIAALTSGPPVDPRAVPDPWNHSDPRTWVAQPPLDLIIVAPHGLTVPGGFGPAVGVDTGWADWNPKYAQGGTYQRYDTPPPRVESFLVEELVPYVDEHFPTMGDRRWRAITGKSQGGFGAFANGLANPDVWSVQAMLSGGGFPFPLLAAEGTDLPDFVEFAAPFDLPYLELPGPTPLLVPEALWSTVLISEISVGFGDAVVDNVWWRGINPVDLLGNARAWAADGTQSTYLMYHVNDAIPRRIPEDLLHPSYASNQGFETALLPMDLYMEHVLDALDVDRTFHVGPGLHNNDPYQQPYYREHLESYAAQPAYGTPRPDPDRFDYRTHRRSFDVWGWSFEVERQPEEFLFLTDATCESLTLRGSGVVHIRPPARCDAAPVAVDLGASHAVNEPAGAGSVDAYGRTTTVQLQDVGTHGG